MFSRKSIVRPAGNCSADIEQLKAALDAAGTVVIGAGAGLSTSAGFTYSGERFRKHFADFEDKYGFHDMYSGAFCRYDTPEEHWAYWSRFITVNRYMDAPKPVYQKIFELVKDKDYFVITTNVDHCFQKAGFEKKRLFYTQGDYGLFQCSEPCCQETFDNEDTVHQMVERQENMRVPSELLPVCPRCGRPMTMNLRSDDKFVEDEGWHKAAERYENFLRARKDQRILFLELGVGYNTPVIIKYPFWRATAQNPKATYVCINYGEAVCPGKIEQRSICIDRDIGETLSRLTEADQ
ncbi:MAG: Sir2 silent information regulator family NAD-dependent deacetylase [Oscillibacter sp.]|nr:Sir2 silent information regulator family NAD-dependent deacetylase [Oscillibacter sp.]